MHEHAHSSLLDSLQSSVIHLYQGGLCNCIPVLLVKKRNAVCMYKLWTAVHESFPRCSIGLHSGLQAIPRLSSFFSEAVSCLTWLCAFELLSRWTVKFILCFFTGFGLDIPVKKKHTQKMMLPPPCFKVDIVLFRCWDLWICAKHRFLLGLMSA